MALSEPYQFDLKTEDGRIVNSTGWTSKFLYVDQVIEFKWYGRQKKRGRGISYCEWLHTHFQELKKK